jgi:glycosyltransferase 2 family protein
MTKKLFITTIKVLILVLLMAWVIERIQFRDVAHPVGTSKESSIVGQLVLSGKDRAVFSSATGRFHVFRTEDTKIVDGFREPLWREESTGMAWRVKTGVLYRLAHMDFCFLSMAAVTFFLCFSFAAIRWNQMLRICGLVVSHWETWKLCWVGAFFNNFVPGLTGGDVIRAYLIARRTGKKTAPVLTVLVDRIVGVTALALLCMLVIFFNLDKFHDLMWGVFSLLFAIGLLSSLFLSRSARSFVSKNRWMMRLMAYGPFSHVLEAIEAYRSQKALLLLWLIASMVNHVFSTGVTILLALAMGFHASLVDFFVLVPLVSIASTVPITPSGWGVSEALSDFLFVRFAGLSVGDGAVLAFMLRAVGAGWSLLGGMMLLGIKEAKGRLRVDL